MVMIIFFIAQLPWQRLSASSAPFLQSASPPLQMESHGMVWLLGRHCHSLIHIIFPLKVALSKKPLTILITWTITHHWPEIPANLNSFLREIYPPKKEFKLAGRPMVVQLIEIIEGFWDKATFTYLRNLCKAHSRIRPVFHKYPFLIIF